jgi:TetR/AcrR family transcriptional regulator, mexJK operon transcriptional repressor
MSTRRRFAARAVKAKRSARTHSKRASTKPGPGRPTAARVEEISRAILTAARDEFKASGYEAARMQAIATAAGVTKMTLYRRYPTKEALLQAHFASVVAIWSTEGERDNGPTRGNLRQRLRRRARQLAESSLSEGFLQMERLFVSVPPMSQLRRARHEFGSQRTVQVIAKDIVESRDQSIRLPAATRIAETLLAMLHGWRLSQQELRKITREEALAYADYAVEVLIRGLPAW